MFSAAHTKKVADANIARLIKEKSKTLLSDIESAIINASFCGLYYVDINLLDYSKSINVRTELATRAMRELSNNGYTTTVSISEANILKIFWNEQSQTQA